MCGSSGMFPGDPIGAGGSGNSSSRYMWGQNITNAYQCFDVRAYKLLHHINYRNSDRIELILGSWQMFYFDFR